MLSGCQIISFLERDWDAQRCTQEQMLSRLARDNEVLVFEGFISPLALLENPSLWRRAVRWMKGIRKVGDIHVFTPPMVLPFEGTFKLIGRINRAIRLAVARAVMRRLNFQKPIHVVYYPWKLELVGKLNERLVVYHCIDKFTSPEYEPDPDRRGEVGEMERLLCERADIVFATSRNLTEHLRQFNGNTFFLPNAADVELFAEASSDDMPPHPSMAGIPHPIIGFTGMIDNRIDVDLISRLAAEHPDWSLVLIGGVKRQYIDISPLQRFDNICFLGMQKVEDLPRFMRSFDVCLIPYLITEEVKNIYPLKLHEYLATGKPIVTTDMPELRPYGELIYISRDHDEFERNVELALAEEGDDLRRRRMGTARRNTWDSRIAFMSRKIEELLEGR